MNTIDVLKMLLLVYIIFAVFLEPKFLLPLHNNVVYLLWITIAIAVLLFVDIVLGIVLFTAWIITYIKVSTPMKVETHTESTPEVIDYKKPELEERKDVCNGPPVPMEGAAKGLQQYIGHNDIKKDFCEQSTEEVAEQVLQKYVVEDYLKKAAEDGIIEENINLYPNSMGTSQYNIQGIEKNMVGYNYKD
jgi:hypothetical protein